VKFDPSGWLSGVRRVPSPNFNARPGGAKVELLVIHNISLPPGRFGGRDVEALFTNTLDAGSHPSYAELAGLKVSAHFLVHRCGAVTQFVSCNKRAWHAGVSSWEGREGCNDFSIGIELEGTDSVPFDDRQYKSLARLTRRLLVAYPIRAVTGHSDIAPVRKTDPGPCFDWPRYISLTGSSQVTHK
jgi:N-acetyl-anhydromuramoyl-L-alanine amidase